MFANSGLVGHFHPQKLSCGKSVDFMLFLSSGSIFGHIYIASTFLVVCISCQFL